MFKNLVDNLRGVIPAGDTIFILRRNSQRQVFSWERYGLSLSAPAEILPSSETCKVAITALAGGDFEFPKGSQLVSAVYVISISKTLLKPLTVNIQHCVALETPEQCKSLQFVRATLNNGGLPYQFKILQGGQFTPESQYGSISCTQFSLIGILFGGNGEEDNTEGQNGGGRQGENGEEQNRGGGQEENGEREVEEQGVCGVQEEGGGKVVGREGHEERGSQNMDKRDPNKGKDELGQTPQSQREREQHLLGGNGVEKEKQQVVKTQNGKKSSNTITIANKSHVLE